MKYLHLRPISLLRYGMNHVAKYSRILLLMFLLIPLAGCWDRREVESLALVQVLGLDAVPGGKEITVSTTIAIPPKIVSSGGQGGGGGGGSDTGAFTISMNAPTIYEAVNRINTTVNRDVTFLQNAVILIGEDLAKQGVHKWMDTLVRFREMRRTELIFVCKGKAADLLAVKPKLEKNPAEYYRDLEGEYHHSGMFPPVRIQEFLNGYEAYAQEIYAPLLEKYQRKEPGQEKKGGGDKGEKSGGSGGDSGAKQKKPAQGEDVRLVGTAVFKKDKLVGSFDIYESQVLLMLLGKFREGFLSIADPQKKGNLIAFRLLQSGQPAIKYSYQGNAAETTTNRFKVNLKFEAELLSIQSTLDYSNPKLETLLAHRIVTTLKRRIEKVLTKAQKKYNSDVFGFGSKVRETFLTDQDWVRYQWPDHFRDAQIDVNVKVALRRAGVQFQPPQNR